MQMNFYATLRATRAALPHDDLAGFGSRSSTSRRSTRSSNRTRAPIDYGAAKAGVVNLHQDASPRSSASTGSTWNAVSPGPVSTDLWLGEHGVAATVAAATGSTQDTARANVVASIGGFATGRFTDSRGGRHPRRIPASPRTANVTGANFVIDGGLIKTT